MTKEFAEKKYCINLDNADSAHILQSLLLWSMVNGQKFNQPSAKKFLGKSEEFYIGLRFTNFGSEMVENRLKNKFFVGLRHSLLMDLGYDQQQHPTAHSGGVSRRRVRGCWRFSIKNKFLVYITSV